MKIFASATSLGLKPYRDIVANVLLSQKFEVVVQETFATPDRSIYQTLREGLTQCRGVIALVGPFYGAESPVEKDGVKLSYTQYELEFALANGLDTLVLFTSRNFQPALGEDGKPPQQSPEQAELQEAFIRRVKSRRREGLGWSKFGNELELALALAKTDWRRWR